MDTLCKLEYTLHMNLETPPLQEVQKEKAEQFVPTVNYQKEIEHFLDANHAAMLGGEALANATEQATYTEKNLWNENTSRKEVAYDKYKKSFLVDGEKVTLGQLVASRHFNENFNIPTDTAKTFEGKKLQKTYTEYAVRDVLTKSLNKDLATMLAEKAKREDMFKSKAYEAIASREGNGEKENKQQAENKQLGVVAEKMMQGIAEMIALDRPDLHLEIRPANAFQDVEEKIDFIITAKTKKRGVGIEASNTSDKLENNYEERNYGIQFTVNASKTAHKMDQIEKARGRATDVDDILLVSIDQTLVRKALADWNKNGRHLNGPFGYMPENARQVIVEKLFEGVLQKEEIESLQKGI